jgi:hypothetical protein
MGLALCRILRSSQSLLRITNEANANSSVKRIKIKYSVDVIIKVNLNVGETLLEIISQMDVSPQTIKFGHALETVDGSATSCC